jgi:hypothetical protein
MYSLLKVSYKEVTPEKRGFAAEDLGATNHLENIGISFLDGYHHSLDLNSVQFICRSMNQKEKRYRGFGYEGAAMGIAIKDAFRLKRNKIMPGYLMGEGDGHIYMSHVGIGWAYARLPFNIEKELVHYDPLMRWLIIDGFGFHEAYFKTRQFIKEKKIPKLSPFAKHVFYQGVGRCLWFVCGMNISEIRNTISSFEERYHKDLWAGIGLACVYAGEVQVQELTKLKMYSGNYLPNLLQGAAFAAKARARAELVTEYTEAAVLALTGLSVRQASKITDDALEKIPEGMNSQSQYTHWRNTIAEMLLSTTKS